MLRATLKLDDGSDYSTACAAVSSVLVVRHASQAEVGSILADAVQRIAEAEARAERLKVGGAVFVRQADRQLQDRPSLLSQLADEGPAPGSLVVLG